MSAFTPSDQFSKRWLSIPVIAKQAFLQELGDIIALLQSNQPAQEFVFSHQNFDDDIVKLLHIYDNTQPVITPTDDNTIPLTKELTNEEIGALEDILYRKLSNRLDDFLSEQMAQQSEELRGWIKNLINAELSIIRK